MDTGRKLPNEPNLFKNGHYSFTHVRFIAVCNEKLFRRQRKRALAENLTKKRDSIRSNFIFLDQQQGSDRSSDSFAVYKSLLPQKAAFRSNEPPVPPGPGL